MEFEEICNCISIIHLLFISFKIWTTLAFHSYFIKRMSLSLTMTNRKMLSIPFLPSKLLSKEILGKYPLYTIFFSHSKQILNVFHLMPSLKRNQLNAIILSVKKKDLFSNFNDAILK